ncbi:MAG: hypothetical protein AAF928_20145 [Myxococcota bacterium]
MSARTADALAPAPLSELLDRGCPHDEIRSWLDSLSRADRVQAALALRGSRVGRLYRAVAGGAPVYAEDFVAASTPDDTTVIMEGRNSLPAFSRFQKRFARLGETIVGYNHQSMSMVTGPGYFEVVRGAEDDAAEESRRGLYFDYTRVPSHAPTGWPPVRPNTSGLSRLVYAHMTDTRCRGPGGVATGHRGPRRRWRLCGVGGPGR